MELWKQPPRAKVFEAFTAVADGRVRFTGPGSATVTSSRGDKTYDVTWTDDGRTVAANDNASYWQGYAGYPILAVLVIVIILVSVKLLKKAKRKRDESFDPQKTERDL